MSELTAGLYDATEAFRAIPVHAAVMKAGTMELVAVTGAADDPLSEGTARLFAAAPALVVALAELIELKTAAEAEELDGPMENWFAAKEIIRRWDQARAALALALAQGQDKAVQA